MYITHHCRGRQLYQNRVFYGFFNEHKNSKLTSLLTLLDSFHAKNDLPWQASKLQGW